MQVALKVFVFAFHVLAAHLPLMCGERPRILQMRLAELSGLRRPRDFPPPPCPPAHARRISAGTALLRPVIFGLS